MTQPHVPSREPVEYDDRGTTPPRWVKPLRFALVMATIIAGVLTPLPLVGPPENDGWNALALLSCAVSLGGVAATLLVYERQHRRTVHAERAQGQQLNVIGESVAYLRSALIQEGPSEVDESEEEGKDARADSDVAEGRGQIIKIGDRDGRYLAIDEIPLNVIADLLIGWRENDRKGGTPKRNEGRWSVGNLVGAWRPSGQGNHPWYLTFRDDAGDFSAWRLYRGGQGKTSPTVDDVTPRGAAL